MDEEGRRMKLIHLKPFVLDKIAKVRSSFLELILDSVDVDEHYCISISFRRRSNSEALNRRVNEAIIDRNNRWRKIERTEAKIQN